MDPGAVTTEVVAYVARDGVVGAERRRPDELGPRDVRVAVDVVTMGSFGLPTGRGVEPLGDAFVGRVVECGTDVNPSRVGTRVVGLSRQASAASEIVAPAFSLHTCDHRFPPPVITTMITSGLVAAGVLECVAPETGALVAVLDAGNGTSCVLAGLLRARGAVPVAVRSQRGDEAELRRAGFEIVLGPDHGEPGSALRDRFGGRAADLVIDCTRFRPAPWASVTGLLSDGGHAVKWVAGSHDWDPERSTTLGVVAEMVKVVAGGGDPIGTMSRRVTELADHVRAGRLYVPIHEFPAADAQGAYDAVRRGCVGRVVIRLDGPASSPVTP